MKKWIQEWLGVTPMKKELDEAVIRELGSILMGSLQNAASFDDKTLWMLELNVASLLNNIIERNVALCVSPIIGRFREEMLSGESIDRIISEINKKQIQCGMNNTK